LLADACSFCGKYQRRQQVYRRVPTPTMCVCGDLLGAAETVKLPTDHVIVDAQPQVLDVINEGDVSFGVFVATRSSVRDVLVAARSLANRVLNYASTHGLAAVKSAEVSWPIADDPGLNPLLARNALKRKGTGASNRGGHRNYRGSAHSASTDHQGCGQPRRSIHRRAER